MLHLFNHPIAINWYLNGLQNLPFIGVILLPQVLPLEPGLPLHHACSIQLQARGSIKTSRT